MRLIRPSFEIIEQGPGLQGIYDIIEKCGKVSYKSEAKGGETAKRFVEARAKEKHGAVLEFGTVYLRIPVQNALDYRDVDFDSELYDTIEFYKNNKYTKSGTNVVGRQKWHYFTTNYRVLVENNRLDDLKYLCEPTEYHQKRYTVKFITDIGVGREFLRHRVMSMVQESTRYVNYSKEKFGEQCTFVIPPWIGPDKLSEGESVEYWDGDWVDMNDYPKIVHHVDDFVKGDRVDAWLWALDMANKAYKELTNDWSHIQGINEEDKAAWPAQYARGVLPLATKTEFVLCGFTDAWIHFFCLRTDIAATGKPHPQAQELANPARDEFIKRGYINEEWLKHDSFAAFDVVISDSNLKD